ncbi:unnamed protein product [Rotaria sordida]|uniref:Amine oxidase n=1 Tax=Rotaria sordida TaxID=392033 RepID=A0A814JXC3_9BILA|nr:unnamed protein product [Rotaria sordida]CAF3999090.1 unnamed protein product [Rotaria sordida]
MEYIKVIIVGGGVAGLAAAKTLGRDVNYVLIEAQNYLGGRILTVDAAPDLTIDLGAQYVHGDKKNTVYDICDELNILLSDDEESDDDALIVTSEGKHCKSEILDKATDLWERTRNKAEEKYDDRTTLSPISFADIVPKEFQKRLLSSSSFSKDLIQPFIDYFMKLEMTETSCLSLSDLNLIEYLAYEDLEGEYENDLKNGGYRPFINYLKSFIPNDKRIRLNCEVIRVKFMEDDRKLLVEMNYLNQQCMKTIICDHIIWTTSLGYLKENFHMIFADEPKLIQQKQNSITNIGFGTVNKVIMIYKKKFWSRHINSIVLLHTKKDLSFEISDELRQQLQIERVDSDMFKEIVNMLFHYDVLPSTDIPVLICWFVGPTAIMIENLSEKLIGQVCHEVLCNYLNIVQEKYQPVRILKSEWHSNKYIRGSYSYSSIKSTKHDRRQLQASYAPDGIRRIVFAGEATHEHYYSTVNAALETGILAANKILSIIG